MKTWLMVGLMVAGVWSTALAENPNAAKQALLKKLTTIVLPRVRFEEASVKEVFTFVKEQARSLDLDTEHPFNFVFKCAPEALDRKVTLDMDRIPLGEAIRYICMGSDLSYRVDGYAIVVSDGTAEKERMTGRVFTVDPSLFTPKQKPADSPTFGGDN